jgi:hypothetical protein
MVGLWVEASCGRVHDGTVGPIRGEHNVVIGWYHPPSWISPDGVRDCPIFSGMGVHRRESVEHEKMAGTISLKALLSWQVIITFIYLYVTILY